MISQVLQWRLFDQKPHQLLFLLVSLLAGLSSVNGQITFSAGSLPATIPDPGNLNNIVTVSGLSGTVATASEVQINVEISHGWASDIVIGVTPPGGTEIIIVNRIGGGVNIDMAAGNVLSFRSNAAAVVAVPGTNGIIPAGVYLPSGANPVGSFSSLVGATRNGNWTIRVRDDDSIIQGSLQSASITFFTCPTFSGAPANVSIVNSTCSSNTLSGGSITAPTGTPCPAGSTLQYQLDGGGWSTTLPVYDQDGPAQSIKTRCACNTDGNNVSAESSAATTIPGTCAPANDLCANATPISCGTTISSSNINATAEPGSFLPCGVVQTTAGVWYTFTGDGGAVMLSTCSAANFDTKISVYTGGCTTPTCVAGNDDACSGSRSSVGFTTTNGTVYLVLIHGFGGATGTFDLAMTCMAPCPTFSGAPANVSIVNSSCGSGCTLTGGSITAPTGTPCPAGATLEYNVNNTGWTTTLPVYDQDGPAQTIRTRCACDNDGNNVSAESNPVSTIPGTLPNPVVPANGASTVACPALATQPTPPTVTACDGSVITPTAPTVTNNPNPLTCEGTRTYTWTYNCGSTSATWSYVYTIERQPFTVPANGAATVNNPALATAPTPPTVLSNCGETLTPSAPAITDSPNPVVCTGTRTYAYTYTDCEGNTAVWSFVYTVIDNTPPTPTAGAIAACYPSVAAAEAAALAATTATDNCPGMLTETASTAGTCSAVVTVTTTDAAGNPASVMYNTRIDNTPPTLVCRTATVVLNNAGGYTLTAADVFNIGASSDNCPGALTVTNISPTSVNCNQVGQTVPVVVTVQDGCGNTATCTAQITVQEGTALPAGWSNANVGAANGTAGYKVCSGQQFTVTASGFSTLNADVMHVAYQQLCGNGSITARVTNVTGGGWGGVILRESLSPGAKKAVLKTQLNSIIRRELRTTTNGVTSALNFNRPQHEWLRLTRSGSIIEGYTSTDGVSWTFAFSANISMSSCVQVGLFSESINVNTATTATFTNVVLSGGSPALAEGTTDGFYGMDQALSDIDVTVAPNPTRGLVNLQFQAAPAAPVTIEVFNLLGERVNRMANQDVAGASLQVDLQGRPAGVYYLHISAAGVAPVVKRIVVTGE